MSNNLQPGNRSSIIPILAIVIPCYNEEAVLHISARRLLDMLSQLQASNMCSPHSFLVFVDDGSDDSTWDIITSLSEKHSGKVRGVRLTRNFGHQAALIAGLEYVRGKCDIAVTIDADLQDDISVIEQMIIKYREGDEIVLGVRTMRENDSFLKRWTAIQYYRLMKLLGVNLIINHADFRMMSARILEYLERFPEYHLFLRAMIMMLHNRIGIVTYHRASRLAGETKYNLRKMVSLGWDGITSFSVVPLRLIMCLGAIIFVFSIIIAIHALIAKINGHVVPGWTSVVVPLYSIGGLIMFSLGIVGEYIGKIFIEVKHRPRFLVDSIMEGKRKQEKDAR